MSLAEITEESAKKWMEYKPLWCLRCYLSEGIKFCLGVLTLCCCSCVGELEIKLAVSSYSCTSNPGTFRLYFVSLDPSLCGYS